MKNKKDTRNWIKIRAVCARCGTDLTYKINPEEIWERDYGTTFEWCYAGTERIPLCHKCYSVWSEERSKLKKIENEWDVKFFK